MKMANEEKSSKKRRVSRRRRSARRGSRRRNVRQEIVEQESFLDNNPNRWLRAKTRVGYHLLTRLPGELVYALSMGMMGKRNDYEMAFAKRLGIDPRTESGRLLLFASLIIRGLGYKTVTTTLISLIADHLNLNYVYTRTMINALLGGILYLPSTIIYHFIDDHFEKRVPPKIGKYNSTTK